MLDAFVTPFLYIYFVRQCHTMSEDSRRALHLLRGTHNALLSLFSFLMSVVAFQRLCERSDIFCETPRSSPIFFWMWYFSKVWEWLDTAFLIAANKPISWLHYNHHMTTVSVVSSQLWHRAVPSPLFDVAVFLNTLVHTVMYAYYFSPVWFRGIRRWITRAQLAQHCCMIVLLCCTMLRWKDGSACDVPRHSYRIALLAYGMYLVQFASFYRQNA